MDNPYQYIKGSMQEFYESFGRTNPYVDGKWYWYAEDYSVYGPYETYKEAKKSLDYYVEHFLR